MNMKRSIFIINQYKRIYNFEINRYINSSRTLYTISNNNKYSTQIYSTQIYSELQYISSKKYAEIDISMPLLKKGDKFYFESENKEVTIVDVIRSDKDAIIYYIDKEIIEDEESFEEAKMLMDKYFDKILEENNNIKYLENLKEKYKNQLIKISKHPIGKFLVKEIY